MTAIHRGHHFPTPEETDAFRLSNGNEPVFRQAVSLWCWYYFVTEEFDRSVCSLRKDDVAMPTTVFERVLCTRYAAIQMKAITRSAKNFGIPDNVLSQAREAAGDMKHEQQERWIEVHPPRLSTFAI